MATKKELKAMSVEELEKHIQGLSDEKDVIRQEQLAAHEILDAKNAEEAARAKLDTMSDPEKAALLQELKAEGIESKSKAGTPGA